MAILRGQSVTQGEEQPQTGLLNRTTRMLTDEWDESKLLMATFNKMACMHWRCNSILDQWSGTLCKSFQNMGLQPKAGCTSSPLYLARIMRVYHQLQIKDARNAPLADWNCRVVSQRAAGKWPSGRISGKQKIHILSPVASTCWWYLPIVDDKKLDAMNLVHLEHGILYHKLL